jgi:hypothetical protein
MVPSIHVDSVKNMKRWITTAKIRPAVESDV